MTVATPVRTGVSLDELLAAKERRAARQADMLEHYQQPVISLTLVTPGEIKDSLRYRNTMGVALQTCDQLLWENRCGFRPGPRPCGAWLIRQRKLKRTARIWSRRTRSAGCGIWMLSALSMATSGVSRWGQISDAA